MENTICSIGPSGENKRVPLLGFHKISAPRPKLPLPAEFAPANSDVICGRGKQRHNHAGNKRFRATIATNAHSYMRAYSKLDKTLVVLSIVENIREGPPVCRFVKQDEATGRWHDIGDLQAREKVGHALRDAISSHKKGNRLEIGTRQKASSKAKPEKQGKREVAQPVKERGVLDEHFEKFMVDTFLEPTDEGSLGQQLAAGDLFAEIPDGLETGVQPSPLPTEVPEIVVERVKMCPHFNFGEKQLFDAE